MINSAVRVSRLHRGSRGFDSHIIHLAIEGREKMERMRGAVGNVLNNKLLLKYGKEYLDKTFGAHGHSDHLHPMGKQVAYITKEGTIGVTNSEGVTTLSKDGIVEVYFTHLMTWTPFPVPLEVLGRAVTRELVDIADVVKTFGDRLDGNAHYASMLWARQIHFAAEVSF